MSNLKIDLITGAYDRLRISGITVNPGSRENMLALNRLENMAARWESKNVCAGYNFEDNPDLNSDSGIPPKYQDAFESNLAFWLCSDYDKQPSTTLALEMQTTLSQLQSSTALIGRVNYPSRQPRGSGNTLRYNRWQRYYQNEPEAPISCKTNKMVIGDVNDFVEHFDSYLVTPETIASYTISADSGLTILSDSNVTPDINYRIRADGTDTTEFYQVKIIVTTSTGRIETRIINFELTEV